MQRLAPGIPETVHQGLIKKPKLVYHSIEIKSRLFYLRENGCKLPKGVINWSKKGGSL
jgi:hypothetical protein